MTDLSTEIEVLVQTQYLADRFPDGKNKYAFAYRVTILNHSCQTVTLRNRYWQITDADGERTEVAGSGVVGEQPILAAGKQFKYTSGAVLNTPFGTMQGHYEFEDQQGHLFKVPIAVFRLAVPNLVN